MYVFHSNTGQFSHEPLAQIKMFQSRTNDKYALFLMEIACFFRDQGSYALTIIKYFSLLSHGSLWHTTCLRKGGFLYILTDI